jgi:MerR family transcriptional regulator, thiopeptide resistance regulator
MTIGRLALRFGLSRSTLLYYDRIGLLRPSGRSEAGYRRYTERDAGELARICLYRQTGLSLERIRSLRGGEEAQGETAAALEEQLRRIAEQMRDLRCRQQLIVKLIDKPRLLEEQGPMNRERWTRLLRAAGLSEEALSQWHADFEQSEPGEHQQFLEFLNIPEADISRIREAARRRA